jgi:hypothetical protein
MTQATKREARTQLVLMVTAIAVGGVVFMLTGDFVIGVGVGAAVFVLTRQAKRIWRRNADHEAGRDERACEPNPR